MFVAEKPEIASFRAEYAKRADVCEVLERDMNCLYLLAFLLTANHKEAEQCFVATVDEALNERTVFKEWARTWVKRCLIKNAVRIVSPTTRARSGEIRNLWSTARDVMPGECKIDSVTRLRPLERFVFVMSVLERDSGWECSLLLSCSTKEVAQARMRALGRLPGVGVHHPGSEVPSVVAFASHSMKAPIGEFA